MSVAPFKLTLRPFNDEQILDEDGTPLTFDNLMAAIHCARAVQDAAIETVRDTDIGNPAEFAASYWTAVYDGILLWGYVDHEGALHATNSTKSIPYCNGKAV